MVFSITWYFVSFIFLGEIALLLLLILPLNTFFRKLLVENIMHIYDNSRIIRRGVLIVGCLVSLFFVDAIRTVWQYDELEESESYQSLDAKLLMQNTLFYNQRNAYLTGLTLFLMVVVYRMLHLLSQLTENRLKVRQYEAKHGPIELKKDS